MIEKFDNWENAGPIIERERIGLRWSVASGHWCATLIDGSKPEARLWEADGPTPLIAAMRVYGLYKAKAHTP
jgi:hypothetical protein